MLATPTTRQILAGSVATLLAAGAVVTAVLVSDPPDATALGQLTPAGKVAHAALEPIQEALAAERDARQAVERATQRVAALRADLATAEAELARAKAALPAARTKAAAARARWDRDVAGVALPESLHRQVAGIGKAIRESEEKATAEAVEVPAPVEGGAVEP